MTLLFSWFRIEEIERNPSPSHVSQERARRSPGLSGPCHPRRSTGPAGSLNHGARRGSRASSRKTSHLAAMLLAEQMGNTGGRIGRNDVVDGMLVGVQTPTSGRHGRNWPNSGRGWNASASTASGWPITTCRHSSSTAQSSSPGRCWQRWPGAGASASGCWSPATPSVTRRW